MISKPEAVGIGGKFNDKALLIGVIESFIAYSQKTLSEKPGVFMQNSGLARVLPINLVEETVAHAIDRLPDLQALRVNPVPPTYDTPR